MSEMYPTLNLDSRRVADQSHSSPSGPIGSALGSTMRSTGNIAVSATAETGRSMRSTTALTGRKRSFRAGVYSLVTDGRHRQALRLNRTPEYGFPVCTSTAGSRPVFETTVLQPAERPMIPNRHSDPATRTVRILNDRRNQNRYPFIVADWDGRLWRRAPPQPVQRQSSCDFLRRAHYLLPMIQSSDHSIEAFVDAS